MKTFPSRILLLAVPLLAVASFLGMALSADLLAREGWKALSVFSVLGCMALAGREGRRTRVEVSSLGRRAPAPGRREAA